MSARQDGGPAFPGGVNQVYTNIEPGEPTQSGMMLRDYFAAKAMQAAFAGPGASMLASRDGRYDETNWAEIVALNAYEMADVMLAARNGSPSDKRYRDTDVAELVAAVVAQREAYGESIASALNRSAWELANARHEVARARVEAALAAVSGGRA